MRGEAVAEFRGGGFAFPNGGVREAGGFAADLERFRSREVGQYRDAGDAQEFLVLGHEWFVFGGDDAFTVQGRFRAAGSLQQGFFVWGDAGRDVRLEHFLPIMVAGGADVDDPVGVVLVGHFEAAFLVRQVFTDRYLVGGVRGVAGIVLQESLFPFHHVEDDAVGAGVGGGVPGGHACRQRFAARNDAGEDLRTQRVAGVADIQPEGVFGGYPEFAVGDVPGEDGCGDGGALRDRGHRVDAGVSFSVGDVLDELLHGGHFRGATHEHDSVHVAGLDFQFFQHTVQRRVRLLDEGRGPFGELIAGEGVGVPIREGHGGGGDAGEPDFRFLHFEAELGAHAAVPLVTVGLLRVDRRGDPGIEVDATELVNTRGCAFYEHPVEHIQQCHIEGAAAPVDDEDAASIGVILGVRQRRGGGFVNQSEHFQTSHTAGGFRPEPRQRPRRRRDSDHAPLRGHATCLRRFHHPTQHHRRDLFYEEFLPRHRDLRLILKQAFHCLDAAALRIQARVQFRFPPEHWLPRGGDPENARGDQVETQI